MSLVQPKIPTIHTFHFIDNNKGMAAGIDGISYSPPANPIEKGYIIRTIDGGYTWDTVLKIDSISFNKIVFINPTGLTPYIMLYIKNQYDKYHGFAFFLHIILPFEKKI